jgi:hypothetical protein
MSVSMMENKAPMDTLAVAGMGDDTNIREQGWVQGRAEAMDAGGCRVGYRGG